MPEASSVQRAADLLPATLPELVSTGSLADWPPDPFDSASTMQMPWKVYCRHDAGGSAMAADGCRVWA